MSNTNNQHVQGFRQTRLRAYIIRRVGSQIRRVHFWQPSLGVVHGDVCVGSFVYAGIFKSPVGACLLRLGAFIFGGETPDV
jgi:hypothetical protein